MNDQYQQEMQDLLQELRQQGEEQLAIRQWEQARKIFLQLLAHTPQDEDALLGAARALDRTNDFEALYTMAQRILEIRPNSAQGLAYQARALQKLERFSEATIANDQALLLDTRVGLAWINRSGLQLLQGKLPEALRSSRKAIDLAPDDPRAWANYGVALTNYNRLGEALDALNQSLELDEGSMFALQMKGEILIRIGRMRELIIVVNQAIQINPTDVTSLTQAIQAMRTLERYEQLRDFSRCLLVLEPESPFGWEHYMRGLRGLGEFEEANLALDHLLAQDGSNVRFWTVKADTLYRLGRYREAVSAADRAKALAPHYPPALRIHEKALRLMYQRKERKKK